MTVQNIQFTPEPLVELVIGKNGNLQSIKNCITYTLDTETFISSGVLAPSRVRIGAILCMNTDEVSVDRNDVSYKSNKLIIHKEAQHHFIPFDGNFDNPGFKEYFYDAATDGVTSVEVKPYRDTNNEFSQINAVTVDSGYCLTPLNYSFCIEKMCEGFDPHCDTCKNAMASLSKNIISMSESIIYTENQIQQKRGDWINFGNIEVNPVYHPLHMLRSVRVSPYSVGEYVLSNFLPLFQFAKIEVFSVSDDKGLKVLFTVPSMDSSVLF